MARPETNVVIQNLKELEKLDLEKLPSKLTVGTNVLSQIESNADIRSKLKNLLRKEVKIVPAVDGRSEMAHVVPPRQHSDQLSKTHGYRVMDLKSRSFTKSLYSTPRPRPLRGLVATVFGGMGFLGLQLVNELANQGCQVICPVRRNLFGIELNNSNDYRTLRVLGEQGQVSPVTFDPTSFDEISKLVSRSQLVFNCIGKNHDPSPHSTFPFGPEGTYVNLPRNIAKACTMRGVQRFVHVSHVNASPHSEIPFFKAKGIGEEAVFNEFPNAIVVRPSDMFGYGDSFLKGILNHATVTNWPFAGRNIFLLKGKEYVEVQPVWVVDVARALVRSATREQNFGEIIELGGPQKFKLIEVIRYAEALTRSQPSNIRLMSPLETKLTFFGRTLKHHQQSWIDLHLRQDCVPSNVSNGWAAADVAVTDLKKMESIAADFLPGNVAFYGHDNVDIGTHRYNNLPMTHGGPAVNPSSFGQVMSILICFAVICYSIS